MKRHIIFLKDNRIINAILKTGKCKNEGNDIYSCEDNMEDMKILQSACKEALKGTEHKDYRLLFVKADNYRDMIEI